MLKANFIDPKKATALLRQEDEYLQKLNQFNLNLFNFKDKTAMKEAFAHCAKDWNAEATKHIEHCFKLFNNKLSDLFPNQTCNMGINFIFSNGQECGMPYTRKDFIVLISQVLGSSHLLFHEMYHVISRQNPELTKYLYQQLGFHDYGFDILVKNNIQFILNPDAPNNNFYVIIDGLKVTPYADTMNVRRLKFFILDENDKIVDKNDPRYETINTKYHSLFKPVAYLLHPEEIIADAWSGFWHTQLDINDYYTPSLSLANPIAKAIQSALETIPLTK